MSQQKVIIVGAGLAGSLLAIQMANRGFEVELYEKRPDMRKVDISAGRSINLALSNRGIAALNRVGMDEFIMAEAVPMPGRLIHSISGETNFQPYSGREGEYINSISRGGLNKALMDKAEAMDNVRIFFDQKCMGVDFQTASASFINEKTGEIIHASGDVVIGSDGANSAVRNEMMNIAPKLRFSFSQHYLDHGYKELSILPGEGGSFQMEKNALHIWPRGTYMLIALPNFDGSFTVTLFMPFEGEPGFNNLDTEAKVLDFFNEQFPDVVPLIPHLAEEFFENPSSSLATIKCYPWQVNGKSLLIGDSAHAVVPFYGQGMNASFEDCHELDKYIDQYGTDWKRVFGNYQKFRKKDADAIGDLAEENYFEMRAHVADPVFVLKRQLETKLEDTFPGYFSKYSMVTFREDIPYSVAMNKGRAQDDLLMKICSEVDSVEELDMEEVLRQVQAV
ncbi:MAG: FAD-dependent monooxygenase [Bacteroidetes bacterium]|nr:MAG: FAD-dependent monooxygenase [Bacteroidota bacterium]